MLAQTQGAFVCICVCLCVHKKKRGEWSSESALAWFASLHTNAERGPIMGRVHSESFSHRFQQEHSIWWKERGKPPQISRPD